jgi:hypothetical protein
MKQPKYDTSIHAVPFSYVSVHGNAVVLRQLLRQSSVQGSIHILLGVLEAFFIFVFHTAKMRLFYRSIKKTL